MLTEEGDVRESTYQNNDITYALARVKDVEEPTESTKGEISVVKQNFTQFLGGFVIFGFSLGIGIVLVTVGICMICCRPRVVAVMQQPQVAVPPIPVQQRLGVLQQTPTVRLPRGFNAPSPYALLVKDQMKGLMAGGQKVSEAMKTISARWKQLGEHDKQHYMDESRKLRAQRYDEFQKLTEEQKNYLLQKRAENLEKRSQIRQFNAQTNRPKKPMGSFLLFREDLYKKRATPFSTREEAKKFAIEVGEKWKNLSEDERQPHVELANLMSAEYNQNLAAWKIWKSQNAEKFQEIREKKKKN